MCEPTTLALASMALSGTTAALSAVSQQKQANAQAQAIAQQAQADQNAITLEANQTAYQAADEANERNRQALLEAATFDVIAGEYGGGHSQDRLEANIAFNQNKDLASIAGNRDRKLSQLGQESIGVASRARAGQASLQRQSALGAALTIAGSALSSGGGQYWLKDKYLGAKLARQEADETIQRTEALNREAARDAQRRRNGG